MDAWATLNDWLTFTINRKVTVVAIICSELSCCSHDDHIFAAADKNAALYGSCEYDTVGAIIDVDIGADVKHEVFAFVTVFNVELLTFNWIGDFYFKLLILIFEIVVLRLEFLLLYFRWHYVVFWFLGLDLGLMTNDLLRLSNHRLGGRLYWLERFVGWMQLLWRWLLYFIFVFGIFFLVLL